MNQFGAFLNWGLMKDLFCPFREQKKRMEQGNHYIVYIKVDEDSYRLMATAKIDKYLEIPTINDLPALTHGTEVDILIWQKTDLGFKVIVNNRFQGQIYDAYSIFQRLIHKAKKEIILIDNYIDLTVLDRLSQKNTGVKVTIYTKKDTPIKKLDIDKFNTQYPTLLIKHTSTMHDRFLILDNTEIYHIGASIKDLGKKCFGFTKLEDVRWIKTVLNAL